MPFSLFGLQKGAGIQTLLFKFVQPSHLFEQHGSISHAFFRGIYGQHALKTGFDAGAGMQTLLFKYVQPLHLFEEQGLISHGFFGRIYEQHAFETGFDALGGRGRGSTLLPSVFLRTILQTICI